MGDEYREAEQTLLFGVLDALPFPVALLNLQGEQAYVNPSGERLVPSLYDVEVASLPIVRRCLDGESAVSGWVDLASEEGTRLSGQAQVYLIQSEEAVLGALFLWRPDIPREGHYDHLPTVSAAMEELRRQLESASHLSAPVLFLGEPGVGRASFARALHGLSGQEDAPFLEIDCAAGTEDDLSVKLFGDDLQPGAVHAAAGSVFLREIQNLPKSLQTSLAEALKNRATNEGAPLAVRFLASGPPAFDEWPNDDRFDRDLYSLMAIMSITVPPLRDRKEDIAPLASYFLKNREQNTDVQGFSDKATSILVNHRWPDNIRQLERVVADAALRCRGAQIEPAHLSIRADTAVSGDSLQQLRSDFNRQRIEAALAIHGRTVEGKRKAAKELGIGLSTLYRLISRDEE